MTVSPYDTRTTCVWATVLRFLKTKFKSADFYKIVDATEIVGSCRIVGTKYCHPAKTSVAKRQKNGIVRSSQASLRPNVNVTYALFRYLMIIKCGGLSLRHLVLSMKLKFRPKMLNGILINRFN